MMRPSAPVAHLLLPIECLTISSCEDEPTTCDDDNDHFIPIQFAPSPPPFDEHSCTSSRKMNRPAIDFAHEGYRNEVMERLRQNYKKGFLQIPQFKNISRTNNKEQMKKIKKLAKAKLKHISLFDQMKEGLHV